MILIVYMQEELRIINMSLKFIEKVDKKSYFFFFPLKQVNHVLTIRINFKIYGKDKD